MAVTIVGNYSRHHVVSTDALIQSGYASSALHGQLYLSTGADKNIYIGNNDGSLKKISDFTPSGTSAQLILGDGTYVAISTISAKWTDVGANIYRNSNIMVGGTGTPSAKIHIVGPNNTEMVRFQSSGGYFGFYDTAGTTRQGYMQMDNITGFLTFGAENSNKVRFYVSSTEVLRGTSAGVSIGMGIGAGGDPTQKLDVNGTARLRSIPNNNYSDLLVRDSNGVIYYRTVASLGIPTALWTVVSGNIYRNTNVMIGSTSNPAAKLHIVGSAEMVRIQSTNGYISFYDTAGTTRQGYIEMSNGFGFFNIKAENSNKIRFFEGSTETVRFTTTGISAGIAGDATQGLDISGTARLRGIASASDVNLVTTDNYGVLSYRSVASLGISPSKWAATTYNGDDVLQPLTSTKGLWIDGNTYLRSHYASYNGDGLFHANARPVTIKTPSNSKHYIGYLDYGDGEYSPYYGMQYIDGSTLKRVSFGQEPSTGNYMLNLYADDSATRVTVMYADRASNKVGIGSFNSGALPTKQLDINGDLRIRTVDNNNANTNLLSIDGSGNVEYRTVASLGIPTALWTRSGTVLSPVTSGDSISLTSNSNAVVYNIAIANTNTGGSTGAGIDLGFGNVIQSYRNTGSDGFIQILGDSSVRLGLLSTGSIFSVSDTGSYVLASTNQYTDSRLAIHRGSADATLHVGGNAKLDTIPNAPSATSILVSDSGVISYRSVASLGIPTALWTRSGTVLSPVTSGDSVELRKDAAGVQTLLTLRNDNNTGVRIFLTYLGANTGWIQNNDISGYTTTVYGREKVTLQTTSDGGTTFNDVLIAQADKTVWINTIPLHAAGTDLLVNNGGVISYRTVASLGISPSKWTSASSRIYPTAGEWIQTKASGTNVRLSTDATSGIIEIFNSSSGQELVIASDGSGNAKYGVTTGKEHQFSGKVKVSDLVSSSSASYITENSGVLEKRTLPVATDTVSGTVKIGDSMVMNSGVLDTKINQDLRYAVLTSDVVNSTLTDSTALTIANLDVGIWYVRVIGTYSSAASTTGGKMTFTFSGTQSWMRGYQAAGISASTVETELKAPITTSGSSLTSTGTAGTYQHWEASFSINVSASGDLELKWASEVNASAATLKIGTLMEARRMNEYTPPT